MSAARLVLVNNELISLELDALRGLYGADLEGVVHAVPEKAFLVPGLDILDDYTALIIAPDDLADSKAFTYRVQKVSFYILKALDAVELLLNEVGDLLVPGVVAEGNDLKVQAGDSVLSGLEAG